MSKHENIETVSVNGFEIPFDESYWIISDHDNDKRILYIKLDRNDPNSRRLLDELGPFKAANNHLDFVVDNVVHDMKIEMIDTDNYVLSIRPNVIR